MDIESRIKRRQRTTEPTRLVEKYSALSPVEHIDDPAGRGPVLERLLDYLDPVFEGRLPPNAYVSGPSGSGKSAVVQQLFERLERLLAERQPKIHTSTRAQSVAAPSFVYVDARDASSEFAFYHAVLDDLVSDSVPENGIGTAALQSRLGDLVQGSGAGVVVAIDHVGEPESIRPPALVDLFAGLPTNVSWVAIGRGDPDETPLTRYTGARIRFGPYQQQKLVDVLMTRASMGLARGALEHSVARSIADWADGDAHHALAALFVAAATADSAGQDRLTQTDVDAAIAEIPDPCVSLGRVLALPSSNRTVLRALVDLDESERQSVSATTEAIAATSAVDLSAGTVKRLLYEMAEAGVVARVESTDNGPTQGRPPSRVEPRFPPTAFRRLYDLQQ